MAKTKLVPVKGKVTAKVKKIKKFEPGMKFSKLAAGKE